MYQLTTTTSIKRLSDGAIIPSNPTLSDWAEYQDWLNAGNMPEPYPVPPPPRITAVTMRQARLALLGAGLLPTVNAAIAAMTGAQGEAARIEWEYSQEVQRDRGLVASLGTSLGMTPEQLDALFTTASSLP